MIEWEEPDKVSSGLYDSDHFEDDSLCSWNSEQEVVITNNWRGWRGPPTSTPTTSQASTYNRSTHNKEFSLVELCAQTVAWNLPFELVERFHPPVPEPLQLCIAFWSFPLNEDDIRLYSCLANGNPEEFSNGESLYKTKTVQGTLQIGFHLSATVVVSNPALPGKGQFNVAITFDRRRITSCNCTCASAASWCRHIVSVCLHRIHEPRSVKLRAPVSESLSRLHRDQLQKFAQYLISELPQQILPTAQRLLDDLLSPSSSSINNVCGAPDPTAGASAGEQTAWCLDEATLHENIRRILNKFCVPSPIVFSDVYQLTTNAPPAAAEWSSLLRPLRGREPEGMWNLLSIVREMFRRHDGNAIPLLQILTEECLLCDQILVWWFNTKVALHVGASGFGGKQNVNSNSHASQHACSSLCDEIVQLWRLAALNPALSPEERRVLKNKFIQWHLNVVHNAQKNRPTGNSKGGGGGGVHGPNPDAFSGFKPAIEACFLDWIDYPIPSVTYSDKNAVFECCVSSLVRPDAHSPSTCPAHVPRTSGSVSSEGFCDSQHQPGSSSDECDLESTRDDDQPARVQLQDCDENWDGSNAATANAGIDRPVVDEYQVYYYDPKLRLSDCDKTKGKADDEKLTLSACESLLATLRCMEDPLEILFARAEALHAHGHSREACTLAVKLAHELLAHPPELMIDIPPPPKNKRRRNRINPASHHVSCLASATLAKAAFLCTVLSEHSECFNLAFRVGLYGLEMCRPPASTKTLEVKLANQELDLVALLKKIPLGPDELEIIRSRAEALRNGSLRSRGEALLPLNLASYIFDALVLSTMNQTLTGRGTLSQSAYSLPTDESLAFDAAVSALGLKANVSEADHPLLCEGTRKQRHDLAITLLFHYKDDREKLARIMDRLLDREVHPMYKGGSHASLSSCYPNTPSSLSTSAPPVSMMPSRIPSASSSPPSPATSSSAIMNHPSTSSGSNAIAGSSSHHTSGQGIDPGGVAEHYIRNLMLEEDEPNREEEDNHSNSRVQAQTRSTHSHLRSRDPRRYSSRDREDTSSPTWEEDYKVWEAKFRCTNLRSNKKSSASNPMASIDSSAPETTSSDNSPTLIRRAWMKSGPGSDSGSSGSSSDGLGSSSDGGGPTTSLVKRGVACASASTEAISLAARATVSLVSCVPGNGLCLVRPQENLSPPIGATSSPGYAISMGSTTPLSPMDVNISRSAALSCAKTNRFKGKRVYPTVPNQPSEAGAHSMFEMAKAVLQKAGGSSTTSLFTEPSASQNPRGPHRALHMCAFQIGLYALGLHNCVSPNWLSRTYSSHVSWIAGQALEIGAPAINFLMGTWEGHLTPPEVANLADRASRSRDATMVRAAAELALSCLPHAHALNPSEIQRAIIQCKEQSEALLEQACLAVEGAAKGGGVAPEVLFGVAHCWYDLYLHHSDQLDDGDMAHPILEGVQMELPPPPPPPLPLGPPITVTASCNSTPTISTASAYPFPIGLATYPYPSLTYLPSFHGQIYMAPHNFAPQFQPPLPPQILAAPPFCPPAVTLASLRAPPSPAVLLAPGAGHLLRGPPPQTPALSMAPNNSMPPPITSAQAGSVPPHHYQNRGALQPSTQVTQQQLNYLLSAYRVGMLAMETLARKVHDDRPQAKYARNPPYGEDVKWLLGVAKRLGTVHLHQFCYCAVNSVVSPFVIHDITIEAAKYLSRGNPTHYPQHLRSPVLTPLVQKCQQMFIQCTHQRLFHISPAEYEEFVSILCTARSAFQLTPGGIVQFNELLQSLRRSKSCKKDLWQRITTVLQQSSPV